jgi:hypothetical protein
MKKLACIVALMMLLGCGDNRRTATDQTDENVSPNQTISPEEAERKDSTWQDVGVDSASQSGTKNQQPRKRE